ncbi:hypothetical protein NQZ68_034149 [Dissostichus eleginoides]|nr:hypothetical protein NQZ68_034149 [Dissostichus eleginoides]
MEIRIFSRVDLRRSSGGTEAEEQEVSECLALKSSFSCPHNKHQLALRSPGERGQSLMDLRSPGERGQSLMDLRSPGEREQRGQSLMDLRSPGERGERGQSLMDLKIPSFWRLNVLQEVPLTFRRFCWP